MPATPRACNYRTPRRLPANHPPALEEGDLGGGTSRNLFPGIDRHGLLFHAVGFSGLRSTLAAGFEESAAALPDPQMRSESWWAGPKLETDRPSKRTGRRGGSG